MTESTEQPAAVTTPAEVRRPCRACGCPLLFCPNLATGKTVPLDTRSPVYFVLRDADGALYAQSSKDFLWAVGQALERNPDAAPALLSGIEGAYCTHFATCADASRFHKAKPAAGKEG
jgi:hypothetical protein